MGKLLILIFFVNFKINAQDFNKQVQISKEKLNELKVEPYVYEYSGSFFEDGKKPNFINDRNLSVKTTLINTDTKKEVDMPNTHIGDTLHLIPKLILLNVSKKTISINGFVTGGWDGGGSDVHIYIGTRKDTVQYIKLSPSLEGKIYYNGTELTETVIIDTIPAFVLKNFVHVNSENAYKKHPERAFEITSPIEKNSILVIGQNDCFAEIYEIGKLLEYVDPNNKVKGE